MSTAFILGIQSYCFRGLLPISELIDALEAVGLSYVELWPGHLRWDWDETRQEAALAALREKGITMNAYGAVDFGGAEAQAQLIFDFARKADIPAITTTWIAPRAYPLVERLSEQCGVKLAIHNHGRDHHYGTFDQIQAVFAATSPRVGLCIDTAWFLDAGCDPAEAVERFKDRLYGVHLKDFVFDHRGGTKTSSSAPEGWTYPSL
jgi:inosose dehydratase